MSKNLRCIAALSTLALASVGITALPGQANASTRAPCSITESGNSFTDIDFGTNVPVILIHGLNGTPADWESRKGSSICDNIDAITGASVALNFKYTMLEQTDPATVRRLVSSINWIADQSELNGGPGKVIVVAYSLGTVFTRMATQSNRITGKVGQVITIAAPPTFPSLNYPKGIVVKALAGNIWTQQSRKSTLLS